VLILIDSCFSGGTIISSQGSNSKSRTEIIAACSYLEKTPAPKYNAFTFAEALLGDLENNLGSRNPQPFTAANLHRGMSERIVKSGVEQNERDRLHPFEEILDIRSRLRIPPPPPLPEMPVHFNLCDDFRQPSIPLKALPFNDEPQRIDSVNDGNHGSGNPPPTRTSRRRRRRNIFQNSGLGQSPDDMISAGPPFPPPVLANKQSLNMSCF
jgi:hypothetical protein